MDKLVSQSRVNGRIDSILIVRLKALGDILLSFPFAETLRRLFPSARIDYLCYRGLEEALAGNDYIDEVLSLDRGTYNQLKMMIELRKRKYDLALDLISSPRSAIITAFTGAKTRIGMDVGRHNFCFHHVLPRKIIADGKRFKCYTLASNRILSKLLEYEINRFSAEVQPDGYSSPLLEPERFLGGYQVGFPVSEKDSKWASEFLSGFSEEGRRKVGMVPGAKYSSKSWPIENFAVLSSLIVEKTPFIPVILWGPGEGGEADYIKQRVPEAIKPPLVGISRLAALILELDAVVGVDSGPKHLAVLQGVPTMTLFGPTDPEIWDPMDVRHRVVFKNLDCSPCGLKDCDDNRCMLNITPEEVLINLIDLMAEKGGENGIRQQPL